jgi:hypothetical protein
VLIYKSDQRRAREPAEPGLHDAPAERHHLGWQHRAPDETARGDWMKLVATAGLQWDKASLDYLVRGRHEVERKLDVPGTA